MDCLHCYCQGESHKADNKVCQDYALTFSSGDVAVAIVCDGHGGKRYFRSDIGAKYAAEISLNAIQSFIRGTAKSLFSGLHYTAVGPVASQNDCYKETAVDKAFRQLFSFIIAQWNDKISAHAYNNGISEWESEHVEQKYLDECALNW